MGFTKNIIHYLKINIMKEVNQELLNNVSGAFEMITNELTKPQEDMVAISVCGATRGAIDNILKLYLGSKGVETKPAMSIDDLVNLCIRQDKSFQRYDFSSLNCRCDPSNNSSMTYCLGEDKVISCYRLLVELRNYIFKDLNIN